MEKFYMKLKLNDKKFSENIKKLLNGKWIDPRTNSSKNEMFLDHQSVEVHIR